MYSNRQTWFCFEESEFCFPELENQILKVHAHQRCILLTVVNGVCMLPFKRGGAGTILGVESRALKNSMTPGS